MGEMPSSPLIPAGRAAGPCEDVGIISCIEQSSSRPHDNLGFIIQHLSISLGFADYSVFLVSSSPVLEQEGALMMDMMLCQKNVNSGTTNILHSASCMGLPKEKNNRTFPSVSLLTRQGPQPAMLMISSPH